MINAGIPTVFVNAEEIGYRGTELREEINGDPQQLARFERIRVAGALRMGLIKTPEEAATRQHTPKIAFVAPPATTAPPAASWWRPAISTCWSARCPWASCTTR